jgi:hypothetical protein
VVVSNFLYNLNKNADTDDNFTLKIGTQVNLVGD